MLQSVKLEYFEQRLDDTVTRTEKIPHDLARFGQASRAAATALSHSALGAMTCAADSTPLEQHKP